MRRSDSPSLAVPQGEHVFHKKDTEAADSLQFEIIDIESDEKWRSMSLEEKLAFEKKIVRKLDFKLIPWLTFLYLISFLDRANIGNAKIQGVFLKVLISN
jgi:hypothetical protein